MAFICDECMKRMGVWAPAVSFGPCEFCDDNKAKSCADIKSSKLPKVEPEDMFEKITANIVERMSQYTDSRQPTGDEVMIAWLVDEVDRLRGEVKKFKSLADKVDSLTQEVQNFKDKRSNQLSHP